MNEFQFITVSQLAYYTLQSPQKVFFFNTQQQQLFITIISKQKIVTFQSQKSKDINPHLHKNINPYRIIDSGSNCQVKKALVLNNEYSMLDFNSNFCLKSNIVNKCIQNIYEYSVISYKNQYTIYILIEWQKNQSKPLILHILVKHKEQIKIQLMKQFPSTSFVHITCNNYIVAEQYIIDINFNKITAIQQCSNEILVMRLNPAYDGIIHKQYLHITNQYIVYKDQQKIFTQKYHPKGQQIVAQIEHKEGPKQILNSIVYESKLFITIQQSYQHKNVNQLNFYSLKTGAKIFSIHTQFKKPFLYALQTQLCILELQNLQLFHLDLSKIIFQACFQSSQLGSLQTNHESLLKTLQFRIKQLKGLKYYIDQNDYLSAARMLQSQQNTSIVNDGIRLLKSAIQNNPEMQIINHMITICKCLLNSKYESHVENCLEIMLQIVKQYKLQISAQNSLKQICKMKRIQKILKQDKKKKLFELAYELSMKVEGPNFILKLK